MTHLFETGNVEPGSIDLIVKVGTVITMDAKRTIVLPSGNPKTAKDLHERQVEAIEVDMSEFVKTGGGPHCATAGLIRDPVLLT